VQDFVSYGRLVTCAKASAGKRYGTFGTKIGNAYLKWAFAEAAVLFLRGKPCGPEIPRPFGEKTRQGQSLNRLSP
jgi:hypothetical protein